MGPSATEQLPELGIASSPPPSCADVVDTVGQVPSATVALAPTIGNQLYLVRNLQDPTPGPATCACGAPVR